MGMNKYWSVFKLVSDSNTKVASMESKVAVGLKILTTTCKTHSRSNPIFQRNQIPPQPQPQPQPQLNCFLKSCFLCHKHLSLNKDVYMYRGDQGFCSEECRSRQIYIDDLTQLEISTNKMKFKMKMMRQSLHAGRCNDHHNRHRRKSTASPVFS